jgi:hypothetical protein
MPKKINQSFSKQKRQFIQEISKPELENKMNLILIIAANTLDPDIGRGCELDIANAKNIFADLAKELAISKDVLVIEGRNYTKDNVLEAVEAINPGSDDIVVFYYTGHGFRFDEEEKLKFPQLDLRSHPASGELEEIRNNTQNLIEIYEKIVKKGARLNIVIGDCCNNDVTIKRKFLSNRTKLPELVWPTTVNLEICKKLFLQAKTSIIMAAADKDQLAITDEVAGSIFTLNLMHTLQGILQTDEFDTEDLPWDKLLKKTKTKTFKQSKTFDIGNGKPGNQNPIFVIKSHKIADGD